MSSGAGRQKIQHSYNRWIQKNTWKTICSEYPDVQKKHESEDPPFLHMSVAKAWKFIDSVIAENGIDRELIESKTRYI